MTCRFCGRTTRVLEYCDRSCREADLHQTRPRWPLSGDLRPIRKEPDRRPYIFTEATE